MYKITYIFILLLLYHYTITTILSFITPKLT